MQKLAPRLSVVIPVLNDAPALSALVSELLAADGSLEIVVVDGGSSDEPGSLLPDDVQLIEVPKPGRGKQLAAGIDSAKGEWIWLLHADSSGIAAPLAFLSKLSTPAWGRFDVCLVGVESRVARALQWVARFMNWRSRLTGIATGDQGMFMHRSIIEMIGGMPEQPLMEDIELSKRLKKTGRPLCPRIVLGASGRRWQQAGVVRTILRMWLFRLRYFCGADPQRLVSQYYG
jgi:rSAM/selenodomain-associated transferase 2